MQYKGYLIDLDGTLYVGKQRLKEAEQFILNLQKQKIPFLFVTNNSTKSPEIVSQYIEKLCQLSIPERAIYTSAQAAIDYVSEHQYGKRGFVIGSDNFKQLFEQSGFIIDEKTPDFVLQGLDTQLTYEKLKNASLAIQNGAKFIVTNNDHQMPTENGFYPGSGATTAFLKMATQVEPIILGKPNQWIMKGSLNRIGLDASDVIMVGDNYNTDILAGINANIDTLLTLTGVTKKADLTQILPDKQPTYIVNHLMEWQV